MHDGHSCPSNKSTYLPIALRCSSDRSVVSRLVSNFRNQFGMGHFTFGVDDDNGASQQALERSINDRYTVAVAKTAAAKRRRISNVFDFVRFAETLLSER